MLKKIVSAAAIVLMASLLAGCGGRGHQNFASGEVEYTGQSAPVEYYNPPAQGYVPMNPRPGYGVQMAYYRPPGYVPSYATPAPVYRGSVYGGQAGYGRGAPQCPQGTQWNPQYHKCVGTTLHDIQLSPRGEQVLSNCNRIISRRVVQGDKLVVQQACAEPRV